MTPSNNAVANFNPEQIESREQTYEKWLTEIMTKQSCSRGKAKRVIDAMQRKVVKQFRTNHFKNVMAAQKRRDLGLPEPAPLTAEPSLDSMLDQVTEENIHPELSTGDPVGAEMI